MDPVTSYPLNAYIPDPEKHQWTQAITGTDDIFLLTLHRIIHRACHEMDSEIDSPQVIMDLTILPLKEITSISIHVSQVPDSGVRHWYLELHDLQHNDIGLRIHFSNENDLMNALILLHQRMEKFNDHRVER